MSTISRTSSIVAFVLAVAGTAYAQPTKTDPSADSSAAVKKTPEKPKAIDPAAINALEQMSTFLRQQKAFTVNADAETDYVLDNGQKVTLAKHADLRVRRPDRLRVDVTSDRKTRQYFYDGKTFTMFGQKVGFYTTVKAPATLNELADTLEDKYGLELPMVDLFRFGTDESPVKEITAAVDIGPEKLDGVATEHFAFRQKGVDWQIWIEKGNRPIPHKLKLTTTDDDARPEYTLAMKWTLNATHDDSLFTFNPPKDASRIAITERAMKSVVGADQARRRSSSDRTKK